MRDYKMAPVAWTAFSIHAWREYVVGNKGEGWNVISSQRRRPSAKSPPTPAWVFSPKRLEERTKWFAWYEAHVRGGRIIIGSAHKALVRRYVQMQIDLLTAARINTTSVQEIVVRHFPAGRYSNLLTKAKDQAEDEQDRLNADLKSGKWIW